MAVSDAQGLVPGRRSEHMLRARRTDITRSKTIRDRCHPEKHLKMLCSQQNNDLVADASIVWWKRWNAVSHRLRRQEKPSMEQKRRKIKVLTNHELKPYEIQEIDTRDRYSILRWASATFLWLIERWLVQEATQPIHRRRNRKDAGVTRGEASVQRSNIARINEIRDYFRISTVLNHRESSSRDYIYEW